MNIKIVVGVAVVALLGVVIYAYSQQGTPTITPTGSSLPPVLTPTTGPTAPRARAGSDAARDTPPTKAGGTGTIGGGRTGHVNIRSTR